MIHDIMNDLEQELQNTFQFEILQSTKYRQLKDHVQFLECQPQCTLLKRMKHKLEVIHDYKYQLEQVPPPHLTSIR